MAGGSPNHNTIQVNLTTAVASALRGGPCRFHLTETRVKVESYGLYTYPDASVTCGGPKYDEAISAATLLNPMVIFEVLSPATEAYDRGKKFKLCSAIESLTDYILIAQDEYWVQHYTRVAGEEWRFSQAFSEDGTVKIPSIGCEIPMREIYLDVEFPNPATLRSRTEGG